MPIFWGIPEPALSQATEVARAASDARGAKSDAAATSARVDRALLACEAMWSLMREKLELTDEDLICRMNEIDLGDGKLDGKVQKVAFACPSCGRTISRRLPKCMYCGQAIMHDPFV